MIIKILVVEMITITNDNNKINNNNNNSKNDSNDKSNNSSNEKHNNNNDNNIRPNWSVRSRTKWLWVRVQL